MLRFSTILTVAVGTAALAAPSPEPAGDDAPAPELERALAVLATLDRTVVSIDEEPQPVRRLVEEIDAIVPVPIRVDWLALDALGIDPDDEASLRLPPASVWTTLSALALQLGDAYGRPTVEVYRGQVLLTTLEASTSMALTDVYDVRDLLVDDRAADRLRAEAPPIAVPPESDPAGAEREEPADDDRGHPVLPPVELPEAGDGAMRPEPSRGETLMRLVVEHVDPEAWIEMGGTRASISERGGVLFVTATPTVHRRVRDVLRRLRATNPVAIDVSAAMVDLPRAIYERLARRYEPASIALARAAIGAADAVVVWRTETPIAVGHPLTIESDLADLHLSLGVHPRLDRDTGLLSVEVSAKTAAGEDRRVVKTTAILTLRGGAAIIELPAATPGATIRVLVLIPRRM